MRAQVYVYNSYAFTFIFGLFSVLRDNQQSIKKRKGEKKAADPRPWQSAGSYSIIP